MSLDGRFFGNNSTLGALHPRPCGAWRVTDAFDDDVATVAQKVCAHTDDRPTERLEFAQMIDIPGALAGVEPMHQPQGLTQLNDPACSPVQLDERFDVDRLEVGRMCQGIQSNHRGGQVFSAAEVERGSRRQPA
jgi:hypothetical protein